MDFLDDPFSEPTVTKAPAAGRFQPKAKPRPKKVAAPAINVTKEASVPSVPKDLGLNKLVQPEIVVEKKSDSPNKTSFTDTEFLESSLEDGLSVKKKEVAGSAANECSEIVFSGPSITTVGTAETANPVASGIQSEEEQPVISDVSFASASPLRPCKSQIGTDQSVDKILQESECFEEPLASGDGDFQIDVEQLGAGDFSCLDNMDITSESALAYEKKAVKLLPKPKAQGGRQNDLADAETNLPHVLELPPENQHTAMNGSIHGGEPDTASDAFQTRLDDSFSLDPSYYQSDTLFTDNAEPLMPEDFPQQVSQIRENHVERGSYDELDSSAKSVDEEFLSRHEGIEEGFEYDGINDGFHDNSFTYDEMPNELASNRAENNEVNHLGEETSKKRKPRKTKKEGSEKDKPPRKRKTAAQKPDESTKKPPKKFPHATRRKRCVDRSLLEAPEDELDLQRVPIKDLIVLAEYKERQAKKEAATLPPPPTSERIDDISEDLPYNDNETDLYGDAYDNPSTPVVQADTGYFNYQTFMTKETRARWTKQDTELFYQGISQFGSDLSMIQQLFPGRTRHQIKLKYKKEERQNPMRLHDSLTGRAQDLSHFELVIGRLQEQAARDAKTEDDSVCPTGEDERPEEAAPSTQEDIAESKKKEEGKTDDQEPDIKRHVESPPKTYLSEEDDFDWSEYKSEL